MKLLIAYTTRSGTTRRCAEQLASFFSMHEVTLADLGKDAPDITAFDLVAIGAPVRYGRVDKKAVQFVTQNASLLAQKRHGLFVCCGFADAAEDCLHRSYATHLERACAAMNFGGEMRPENVRGFDRFVVKAVLRHIDSNNRNEDRERDIPIPALLPENIRRFADILRGN